MSDDDACLGTGVLPFFPKKDHWWDRQMIQCPICWAVLKPTKDGHTPVHADERVNGIPITPARDEA